MNQRPTLDLYVTRGCPSCRRAERTLRECTRILELVELRVLELGAPGIAPPPSVIGGPTTVFRGVVLALGTPDCSELARQLESLADVLR